MRMVPTRAHSKTAPNITSTQSGTRPQSSIVTTTRPALTQKTVPLSTTASTSATGSGLRSNLSTSNVVGKLELNDDDLMEFGDKMKKTLKEFQKESNNYLLKASSKLYPVQVLLEKKKLYKEQQASLVEKIKKHKAELIKTKVFSNLDINKLCEDKYNELKSKRETEEKMIYTISDEELINNHRTNVVRGRTPTTRSNFSILTQPTNVSSQAGATSQMPTFSLSQPQSRQQPTLSTTLTQLQPPTFLDRPHAD